VLYARVLRVSAQVFEQCAPDAAALPVVDYLDRHFGDARASGEPYVPGAAEDLARARAERDERDVLVVVDGESDR